MIFKDLCKGKTILLLVFVGKRFLPFAPVGFRRTPEPAPRTRVLSCTFVVCLRERHTMRGASAKDST